MGKSDAFCDNIAATEVDHVKGSKVMKGKLWEVETMSCFFSPFQGSACEIRKEASHDFSVYGDGMMSKIEGWNPQIESI
jgi:hypothetical protein